MQPSQVLELARKYRGPFDVAAVMAFFSVESGDWCNVSAPLNERAYLADRNGGSFGLGQLNLATARDRGYTGDAEGLFDPETNVRFTVRQLIWLWRELKRHGLASRDNLAAAYNEGLGNVLAGVPDPLYTQKFEHARILWRQALGEGP